jgi:hypothetical protein
MRLEFSEKAWPALSRFRMACLAERYDEMQAIAAEAAKPASVSPVTWVETQHRGIIG